MTWVGMSGKGPEDMAVITSTVNTQVDTEILDLSSGKAWHDVYGGN